MKSRLICWGNFKKIIGKQNKFGYKLGLSATIREEFNKERERLLLMKYKVVARTNWWYGLEKAIEDGVLAEMKLIPLNMNYMKTKLQK